MTPAGARELAQGLRHVPQLLSLAIEDRIGNAGVESIVSLGLCHTPRLESLSFPAGCGEEKNGLCGSAGGQILAAALAACPALTRLSVCQNSLGPGGAAALAAALPRAAALAYLDLSSCDVDDAGAAAVAAALPAMPQLAALDLSYNELGAEAVEGLAGALPRMPGLERLGLARAWLGEVSMGRLARGKLPALMSLDLSHNLLGPGGARALGRLLRGSPLLTSLDVSGTWLQVQGVAALAAALCGGPAGGARAAGLRELGISSVGGYDRAFTAPLMEVPDHARPADYSALIRPESTHTHIHTHTHTH